MRFHFIQFHSVRLGVMVVERREDDGFLSKGGGRYEKLPSQGEAFYISIYFLSNIFVVYNFITEDY